LVGTASAVALRSLTILGVLVAFVSSAMTLEERGRGRRTLQRHRLHLDGASAA